MIRLRCGNTNSYYMKGLLIDTDMPGTLPAFYRELKRNGLSLKDLSYVLATHYHPDHIGLISELMARGVKLLLIDRQIDSVHFSDPIFARQPGLGYQPICEDEARVINCNESREFLRTLGIDGVIVPTESHSADGVALITDDGCCFVGDLEPMTYIEAYEPGSALEKDWESIRAHHPTRAYFGHLNDQLL